jgi:hypothetical protein
MNEHFGAYFPWCGAFGGNDRGYGGPITLGLDAQYFFIKVRHGLTSVLNRTQVHADRLLTLIETFEKLLFRHSGLDPESRNFLITLDTGFRRYDNDAKALALKRGLLVFYLSPIYYTS